MLQGRKPWGQQGHLPPPPHNCQKSMKRASKQVVICQNCSNIKQIVVKCREMLRMPPQCVAARYTHVLLKKNIPKFPMWITTHYSEIHSVEADILYCAFCFLINMN